MTFCNWPIRCCEEDHNHEPITMTPLEAIREAARESRERESKATEGPWWVGSSGTSFVLPVEPGMPVAYGLPFSTGKPYLTQETAAFIAAARTELGQWREATLMLAERLYERGPGGDFVLSAVAEKLKGGDDDAA